MSSDLLSRFNPYLVYTLTLKELQSIIDNYGDCMFYDGYLYDIKSKRICSGRYKVYCVKRD